MFMCVSKMGMDCPMPSHMNMIYIDSNNGAGCSDDGDEHGYALWGMRDATRSAVWVSVKKFTDK